MLAVGVVVGATSSAFSARSQSRGNAFAAAASFCNPETDTVVADADSYVDETLLAQGTNFGTASTLAVQSSVLANRRTLVHFTLPAVPAHCSLTSASLWLNASAATAGRTLDAYRAASSWTEGAVTWATAPGVTGSATSSSSGTGWRQWNVTAQADAMYSAANNGFVVRDATESDLVGATQTFSSREGANPPQLVVSFG